MQDYIKYAGVVAIGVALIAAYTYKPDPDIATAIGVIAAGLVGALK